MRVFDEALSLLRAHAIDTLDDGDLYLWAAQGVVQSLRDPWAALLVGDSYSRFKAEIEGTTSGVGIVPGQWAGRLLVARVTPGGPAQRAGVRSGDRLVAVNDSGTEAWSNERAAAALRGPAGSMVRITLERPGRSEPLVLSLQRAWVHQPAVQPGILMRDGIGYLAVTGMTDRAAEELAQQIDTLVGQGMTGLVIDFRSNPGGLIEEGAEIAELFLGPGQTVATMRGRELEVFRASVDERWPDLPLAVLVDSRTASAAEVATAALQDHDRAIVVGTPTFGKGVVQRTYALGDHLALRFTTARWYAPSGRWIQRDTTGEDQVGYPSDGGRVLPAGAGIVPDTTVRPTAPSEAERAYALAVGRDRNEYEDALSVIAVHLVRGGAVSSDSTPVTSRMRAMLFQRLQGSGLRLSDSVFARAASAVERDLGVVMVRAAFGPTAALRRQLAYDAQFSTARALLATYPGAHGVLSLEAARLASRGSVASE